MTCNRLLDPYVMPTSLGLLRWRSYGRRQLLPCNRTANLRQMPCPPLNCFAPSRTSHCGVRCRASIVQLRYCINPELDVMDTRTQMDLRSTTQQMSVRDVRNRIGRLYSPMHSLHVPLLPVGMVRSVCTMYNATKFETFLGITRYKYPLFVTSVFDCFIRFILKEERRMFLYCMMLPNVLCDAAA